MRTFVFSDRTNGLLGRAETYCDRRGTRLTELRRHVLGLVLDSDRPAGPHDLLDRLRAHHKGVAPPATRSPPTRSRAGRARAVPRFRHPPRIVIR